MMHPTAPVHAVDLEPFRYGNRADQEAVARLIDEACRDTGFLQVAKILGGRRRQEADLPGAIK